MSKVTAKKMGRSSLYAGLSEIWRIVSRIALTPLIITQVGLAGYGTWVLLFGVCAYITMFNTSFSLAYAKYTAEYDGQEKYTELSEIISTGMVLVGTLAIIPLSIIWLFRNPILEVLNVPGALLSDAGLALLLVSIAVLIQMSIGGLLQVLKGLQRTDLAYKIVIFGSAFDFIVAIVLLWNGMGLVGLAVAYLSGVIFQTGIAWILYRQQCPALILSPFRLSKFGLKQVVSVGGKFQLLSLLVTGFQQGRKALLSALCGIEFFAIFELAEKLLRLGGAGGIAVISPMMPAFANLHVENDRKRLISLYKYGTRVLSIFSVIPFGFLALFADEAILLWTGQEYSLAAWTIRILIAQYYLNILSGVSTANLRGQGSVRLETGAVLIGMSIFLILFYPAYLKYGYEGLVLVILLGSVGTLWLIVAFCVQESINVIGYLWEAVILPVIVTLPTIGFITYLYNITGSFGLLSNDRWNLFIDLSIWGILYTLLIGVSMWWGYMSEREKKSVLDMNPLKRVFSKINQSTG